MSMNQFMEELESMDPAMLAAGAGLAGIFATLMLVGAIVWYFISALGYRKMFIKAGEAGWKAFIPYYNKFICFKFAWNAKLFIPYLICRVALQSLPDEGGVMMTLVSLVVAIVTFILLMKLDIRVAKSFGKTTGWGVLLFFFPFVVSLILGFGKAEYIGNTTDITEN